MVRALGVIQNQTILFQDFSAGAGLLLVLAGALEFSEELFSVELLLLSALLESLELFVLLALVEGSCSWLLFFSDSACVLPGRGAPDGERLSVE
jgi:hypothetical protein